jgi:hypothetical protein
MSTFVLYLALTEIEAKNVVSCKDGEVCGPNSGCTSLPNIIIVGEMQYFSILILASLTVALATMSGEQLYRVAITFP